VSWDAGAAISFLVGLVTIRLAVSPQMQFYVKTGMRPLLIAAGVLLVVLGVSSTWARARQRRAADPAPDASHQGHGHGGGAGAKIGWAVLAPMAALMLIAPAPLGAFAADRAASKVPTLPQAGSTDPLFLPLPEPKDGAVDMTMNGFIVRALYDEEGSLEGVPVRLAGFVTQHDGGGFFLTRFALSCCAADGRPLKVAIRTDGPAPPTETWLEVVGRWVPNRVYDPTSDEPVPEVALELDRAREIPEPEQPYEY